MGNTNTQHRDDGCDGRGGGWCCVAPEGGDGEFRDTASAGQGRPNKDVQRYDSSSYVDGWHGGNTNTQHRDDGCDGRGGGLVLCGAGGGGR